MPDRRLETLAKLAKSAQIVPTRLTFVDIAGLVRGASKGEGLGNQFLANIREVDAIAHVVRCFEDTDVTHVEGRIDPIADIETVETELMLADLDSLERRADALSKKAKGGDKEAKESLDLITARWRSARRQAGAPTGASRRRKRPSTARTDYLAAGLYVATSTRLPPANGNASRKRSRPGPRRKAPPRS